MSCFIMRAESINKLAGVVYDVVFGHNMYGIWTPDELRDVFNHKREVSEEDIFKALYQLNVDAYKARYGETVEIPEKPEGHYFVKFEQAVSDDGYAYSKVTADHYQIYKTLECFLYQCSEGTVDEEPLFKGMVELKKAFASMIVSGTEEYNNADWG